MDIINETPAIDRKHRPRSPRRWLRAGAYVLVALICFSLAFLGSLTWELLRGISRDVEDGGRREDVIAAPKPPIEPDQPLNILVLGVDAGLGENGRVGSARSDVIMLVSIDPLTEDVSLLSIPRDTRVTIPVDDLDAEARRRVYENPTRIGHAHAFGGPAAAMATVSAFLDLPVQRYVRVNLESFINIVDILGGVDICVEKDMYYADPYQDLVINLKKGCQTLDGQRAMQYVRYRQDSDLHRIKRQQDLITALAEKALQLSVLPKLPQLVDEIATKVDTNLSESEILKLLSMATVKASKFDPAQVKKGMVPGTDLWLGKSGSRVYYYEADEEGLRRMVEELVWRIMPGSGRSQEQRSEPDTQPTDNYGLRIAVTGSGNAPAGESDLRWITDFLRGYGYQVIQVPDEQVKPDGHAGGTTIFLHDDNNMAAKVLARFISYKLPDVQIYLETSADSDADLTIVVGGQEAPTSSDSTAGAGA